MPVFLLVYFLIYGGTHAYLYWKLRQAVGPMGWWAALPASFLMLMVLGPILVRLIDRPGTFRLATAASMVTHVWMALVLWLFCLLLASDVWNLAIRLGALAWAPTARAALRPGVALAGALVLTAAAAVYGTICAWQVRPREVVIHTSALAPGSRPIVIAQLTDTHVGIYTGAGRLDRALSIVRRVKPDVLVSTGDMVDSPRQRIDGLARMFHDVDAPLGKFAILGNHEFYSGLSESLAFHEAAGFRLLRQEHVQVCPGLILAGVDDRAGDHRGSAARSDELQALPERAVSPDGQDPPHPFVILLKHRPDVRADSLGRFDLQLSGHTHGGQIFPFHLVHRLIFKYGPGLHDLGQGSQLYLSRGAGTWGPPMRLFAPPEVTIIRLLPAEQSKL
jgi:hypothetical protein